VLFSESGGGIETGTVQGNLEFMIPRRGLLLLAMQHTGKKRGWK
jgi:hypothetical protein